MSAGETVGAWSRQGCEVIVRMGWHRDGGATCSERRQLATRANLLPGYLRLVCCPT